MSKIVLEAHRAHELSVEFRPPLSTLSQFRNLCRQTSSNTAQLVALSPRAAKIIVYQNQGPRSVSIGSTVFAITGSGLRSAAILTRVGPPSVRNV